LATRANSTGPGAGPAGLHRTVAAYGLLTLTTLFWGGNAVVGRALHADIPPVTLAFWRWTLACLLLLPFAWRRLRQDWPVVRSHWPILLVLSVLGIICFNTMLYQAAHTSSATNLALIQTAMPVAIVLLSRLLFGERISRSAALGVALGMGGAIYVVVRGDVATLEDMAVVPGDLWMLAAVILYALYSVLLSKRPPIQPLTLVAVTFVLGDAVLLPLYLWEWSLRGAPEAGLGVVAGVAYVAVFPSILSYLFWNRGVQLIGANRAGLFICLVPVFASALAITFLGERLHAYHVMGLALIVAGFLLVNEPWRQREPARPLRREGDQPKRPVT
jgi:drug/metabolite transporter (DMT)-like permease